MSEILNRKSEYNTQLTNLFEESEIYIQREMRGRTFVDYTIKTLILEEAHISNIHLHVRKLRDIFIFSSHHLNGH
uniref:S-adenosylmethionine-dependent methyltransferase n=1 Tax=Rhizophora mucronata TaxID=61149 RepID=A0A2P2KC70_RHIMU